MRAAIVSGSQRRQVVDNDAQTVTLVRGRQTVTVISPARPRQIIAGMLDFSTPDNSGLLALLEDI